MTRSELIAALEKATGPDALLDADIWQEIGRPDTRTYDGRGCILVYTASIDAALALVPEGLGWGIPFGPCTAHDGNKERRWWEAEVGPHLAEGATPAIALCIAALRAREARDDGR